MNEKTTLERLDDKVSDILQKYRSAKEENELLISELTTLKAEKELKSQEITRLEDENAMKDMEIEEIVKKIENILS
ncbi:MAG: hypothetical protein U9N02_00540 [Campylobacterota bacterium]|nr:hypothetical protein [Campylobacterota bacterium]